MSNKNDQNNEKIQKEIPKESQDLKELHDPKELHDLKELHGPKELHDPKKLKKEENNKFKCKDTLVLSGGGIYGISQLGALQALDENHVLDNISTYCGT